MDFLKFNATYTIELVFRGTGLNCTKIKLHGLLNCTRKKLHESTKLHEAEFAPRVNFAGVTFIFARE